MVADSFTNPFLNAETNQIDFPYRAIRDVVFILPIAPPESIRGILLPEQYQERYRDAFGIILSVGPGYYDKRKKKFMCTELQVGDIILYDSGILWEMDVPDVTGEKHLVKYCGVRDLQGKVEDLYEKEAV